MNSFSVVGRLGKDPELKYLGSGKPVAKGSIAVRNPFKKKEDGSAEVDWFDYEAWEQKAEFLANYCSKGHQVGMTGRLSQERWTDQHGQNRSRVILRVEQVETLQPKEEGGVRVAEGGVRGEGAAGAGFSDPFESE